MDRKFGNWTCKSCQNLNLNRTDSCQWCGDLKYSDNYSSVGGRGHSGTLGFIGYDVRPGDWYCPICNTHNFASRSSCFKCGRLQDESGGGYHDAPNCSFGNRGGHGRSKWKSGDWICTRSGCNEHNFASRMECYRCNAPRQFNNRSP